MTMTGNPYDTNYNENGYTNKEVKILKLKEDKKQMKFDQLE
jgi:hypothetical protein